MESKVLWLCYELGLKGDYSGLFRWLDNHDAIECGAGMAFVKYDTNKTSAAEIFEELKNELNDHVNFSKNDRIYVIVKDEASNKAKGRFIFGARKQSPWEGFGEISNVQQADSE